jgi:hypothetical protein
MAIWSSGRRGGPAPVQRGQRTADGDVERRRARDAGADRGLAPRVQLEPVDLEVVEEPAEQAQFGAVAQLGPVPRLDARARCRPRRSGGRRRRGRIEQRARRLIAALSVCAPS